MSTMAALLVLQAASATTTAERAMAAHRSATSIGRDPCRPERDDEIVVCGRLTNRYAVPLYRAEGERYDGPGTAVGGALAVKDATAPCHARGEACLKPLPIISIGPGGNVRFGED